MNTIYFSITHYLRMGIDAYTTLNAIQALEINIGNNLLAEVAKVTITSKF